MPSLSVKSQLGSVASVTKEISKAKNMFTNKIGAAPALTPL